MIRRLSRSESCESKDNGFHQVASHPPRRRDRKTKTKALTSFAVPESRWVNSSAWQEVGDSVSVVVFAHSTAYTTVGSFGFDHEETMLRTHDQLSKYGSMTHAMLAADPQCSRLTPTDLYASLIILSSSSHHPLSFLASRLHASRIEQLSYSSNPVPNGKIRPHAAKQGSQLSG